MSSRYEHPFFRWLNRWVLRPRLWIWFIALMAVIDIVLRVMPKRI